jgi:membrane-associated protease RseP (regulator of RpoE activity)
MASGDIITSINGTATPTDTALINALANTTPGEQVAMTYYQASSGRTITVEVVLAPSPYYAHRGFLGVGSAYLTPPQLVQELTWPPGSSNGPLIGMVTWIVLPLAELEPVSGSTTSFFHLSGPLAGLGSGNFWILANVLFWLSWMNLLLGLSNALPLIPLDGGLLFRDFAASVLARLRRGWDATKLDNVAGRLAVASSLLVVFLIIWQFVAPRL